MYSTAVLFFSALTTLVRAQTSVDFENPLGTGSLTFQAPQRIIGSCQPLAIQWLYSGSESSTNTPLTIFWTNEGVPQDDGAIPVVGEILGDTVTSEASAEAESYQWLEVLIPEPGRYVFDGIASDLTVVRSAPFIVTTEVTSCIVTVPTESNVAPPTITNGPSSTPSPSETETVDTPLPQSSGGGSNTGSIVGGVLGGVVFVALLVAFLLYQNRKKGKTISESFGGNRATHKWGGLGSVDTGRVSKNDSPPLAYTTAAFARSGTTDTLQKVSDDDALEKGSPTVVDHHNPVEVLPVLENRTHSKRYSSHAIVKEISQQNSGLAAFTHDRTRSTSLKAIGGANGPPSADPFREQGFLHHRSSSVSVPSTAHPSPGPSEVPPLPSPAPYPTSNSRPNSSRGANGNATIGRSSSGLAIGRPTRKPVPNYEPGIEMLPHTPTNHDSFGLYTNPSISHLSVGNESNGALASSMDSTTPWLQEQSPAMTRHIGLASQGDGPVHYLIPDPPTSPRH